MVEIKFIWDKMTEANHRRSYDTQRKNFVEGKIKDNAGTNEFYKFSEFRHYQEALESKVTDAIIKEAKDVDPNLEQAKVFIFTPHQSDIAAVYQGSFNDGKGVVIGYDLKALEAVLNSEKAYERLSQTTAHELRHHIDRDMIKEILQIANSANKRTSEDKRTQELERIRYLCRTRLEGFAQFDIRNPTYLVTDLGTNQLVGFGKGFSLDKKVLQKETKKVDEAMEFLNRPLPAKKALVIESNKTIERNVPDLDNWKLDLLQLQDEGFYPYTQGNTIFGIIRKAEIRKLTGKTEKQFAVSPDHYNPGFFRQILETVKSKKTMTEFYNYYYQCADNLALNEDELIIRPKHIESLVAQEKLGRVMDGDDLIRIIFGEKK